MPAHSGRRWGYNRLAPFALRRGWHGGLVSLEHCRYVAGGELAELVDDTLIVKGALGIDADSTTVEAVTTLATELR
uniref:Uncharacterized protein n=1 Tax=Thermogemmatispora argillosa TaxID=2045280 RepID=A0A455SZN4_9CHLR|nr:hypothetical protein KTA_21220 [Thermogemmatispora argillosa]